jgi:hypothetical protein
MRQGVFLTVRLTIITGKYREKQTRELGREQGRSEIAELKTTLDRRNRKRTEELAELAELRIDRQRVKTDTDRSDTGRQLK